jgi:hypothetical protein
LSLAAVAGLPALAALFGSTSTRAIRLDFGPGDGPYVSGFQPTYEIDEKVSTHWTTYAPQVALPLSLEGRARVSLRFARVLPETAQVQVAAFGRVLDAFACRGGVYQVRSFDVSGDGPEPLRLTLEIDSHDRRGLGLKLDWLRVEPYAGTRVRLAGAARFRAALLLAVVLFLLRLAGWGTRAAVSLAAPVAAIASYGLLADPWLTHRLLRGVPELLLAAGSAGIAVGLWLRFRGGVGREALARVSALALAAFLMRAGAVNHPDFYYPDLRTHARLVEKVEEGGLAFFASPSKYIAEHGVWRTEAYGRTYAFPYSPAFHLPFVALHLSYDDRIAAMKLWAAALSVVPLVLVWALARRLGLSPLGAVLMVLIPTYTSRLSFAFLPSLFGHAVDVSFLLWLSTRLHRLGSRRVFLVASLFLAACQLAYVSGVINMSILVAALAAFAAREQKAGARLRTLVVILAMGLVASLLSLALYYRDFLPMVFDVVPRIAGGAARAASRYPVRSFWAVAYERTRDFFDGLYPLLAAFGLWAALRRGTGRPLLLAWSATYLLLLLGRAKVPDIFLHGHETLLITPLVCLLAGEALSRLRAASGWGRLLACACLAGLALQGLTLQWRAIAEQLENAR